VRCIRSGSKWFLEKNNESTCCGFQQNSTIASGSDTVLFRLDEAQLQSSLPKSNTISTNKEIAVEILVPNTKGELEKF
jgi:hypothetical protein